MPLRTAQVLTLAICEATCEGFPWRKCWFFAWWGDVQSRCAHVLCPISPCLFPPLQAFNAYQKLRVERSNAKNFGMRKKRAEEEAAKEKDK